ncbi:MAG: branched-chain-amino-acid transaminase [Armatimonadetes bacterium]|nr:branched-chain-amino-acid transaminase [Armatimonadota bacterium]
MDKWVFLNGEFVLREQAHVHIYDHGFLYGDGAFEGIRSYNGRAFKLKEHIERLYNSLKALWIEMPYGPDQFAANVNELLKRNEVTDGYIRVTVTRGVLLGLDPKNLTTPPTVVISTDKLSLYPKSMYENGLDVVTVATRVANPQVLEPRIKSLGKYLCNIQAKIEANQVGAGEGLMLTESGYVAECTGDNIFFAKNGVVYTPPAFLGILEGITRQTAIDLLTGLGIEVVEKVFTRFDLYTADESFLTGTAAEVIPMVKLDGRKIGDGKPGPITKKLEKAFRDYIESGDW